MPLEGCDCVCYFLNKVFRTLLWKGIAEFHDRVHMIYDRGRQVKAVFPCSWQWKVSESVRFTDKYDRDSVFCPGTSGYDRLAADAVF